MIRQLTGIIAHIDPTYIVLNVHGVGYLVHTSKTNDLSLEQELTVHTYLAVRETALDLYGFQMRDELEIFQLLIGLPKIGPKSAAQILANAEIPLLKEAVRTNDPSYLSKMSGIGKKSAEKIVQGLQDKLDAIGETVGATTSSNAGTAHAYARDTIDALISLGYPQSDARAVVQQITEEEPTINNSNDALKAALRILGS